MKYRKIYSISMILIIFVILIWFRYKDVHPEHFGFFDDVWGEVSSWVPPMPFGDVDKIISRIGDLGNEISNLPRVIPREAKKMTDTVIDVALIPPKAVINVVKSSINQLQTDTNNLFGIIKKLFEKLKYFTELLMITINRARVCSEGADRVLKNYSSQTNQILNKISEIHKKIKICPENPFKQPITYYKNCVSQIIPLIKSCYKYTQILLKFYQEILTYKELFPQDGRKKDYCKNGYKTLKTKKDAINYAKKCNYCLHLQSILKLGLDEIKEFATMITNLTNKGQQLERALGKLVIKI